MRFLWCVLSCKALTACAALVFLGKSYSVSVAVYTSEGRYRYWAEEVWGSRVPVADVRMLYVREHAFNAACLLVYTNMCVVRFRAVLRALQRSIHSNGYTQLGCDVHDCGYE